ncbi:DNA helicase [Solibacillus sp. CAU 1738]|uniref:DNA helicase n=1 Tax=Solibacillus sp. CAU 1738 TaxID=3140363 RepID=UPI0032613A08
MRTQKEVNHYIEELMFFLTQKADVQQFEETIKNNIVMKKQSAKTEEEFFDRLMLNITYFVENKAIWAKIFRDTYGKGQVPKLSYVENEMIAQQMRIRQFVSEKMDEYTKMFHSQYIALKVTEEQVVYDYAYASVEHSLRFDFLTYLTMQPQAQIVLEGNFDETFNIIEGYVAYYADQFVNRMELID